MNAMYRRQVAELMAKLENAQEDLVDMRGELAAKNSHIGVLDNENMDLLKQQERMGELGDEINALQGSNYQKTQRIDYLDAKSRDQANLIHKMQSEQTSLSMNIQTACTSEMNDYSQKELKRIQVALNSRDAQEICNVVTDMARQDQEIKRLAATMKSQQLQMQGINKLRRQELLRQKQQESACVDLYAKYKLDKTEFHRDQEKKDNTIAMLRRQVEILKKQRNQFQHQVDMLATRKPVNIGQRYQSDPTGFFNQLRAASVKKQMTANRSVRPGVTKTRKRPALAPVSIPSKVARVSLGMTSPMTCA